MVLTRLLCCLLPLFAAAQPAPALLTQKWTAWGAHPNIEIFCTVLGVDSGAPG